MNVRKGTKPAPAFKELHQREGGRVLDVLGELQVEEMVPCPQGFC